MNTLILIALSLTISVTFSKPSHHDGGFTVDLIHRDSPLSPLYNPNFSLTDHHQNAFRQSMSRAFRLSKNGSLPSRIDADLFSDPAGDFTMKIQIGTPPVQVFSSVNTVSDLTWTQCKPCKKCHKQRGLPFLVPASSFTYQAQPCFSKTCDTLNGNKLPCDTQNICHYQYSYETGLDHKGTRLDLKGVLSEDTFWFGSTSVDHILFGCVNDYNGTYNENVSGIIGLGVGSMSLINQLKPVIKGKFSYCLLPHFYDGLNRTSKIHFGDRATVSGPNVVSTSLVKRYSETFYYINLVDVLVGDKNSSYNHTSTSTNNHRFTSNLDHNENGNMIVDFSTTLTYLPENVYYRFTASLIETIDCLPVYDPQISSGYCFKDLNWNSVPPVTFRFIGGDVTVPPENMFLEVKKGLSCLAVVSASDNIAVLGNLFQRTLMVGFDLEKQKLFFRPSNSDCMME